MSLNASNSLRTLTKPLCGLALCQKSGIGVCKLIFRKNKTKKSSGLEFVKPSPIVLTGKKGYQDTPVSCLWRTMTLMSMYTLVPVKLGFSPLDLGEGLNFTKNVFSRWIVLLQHNLNGTHNLSNNCFGLPHPCSWIWIYTISSSSATRSAMPTLHECLWTSSVLFVAWPRRWSSKMESCMEMLAKQLAVLSSWKNGNGFVCSEKHTQREVRRSFVSAVFCWPTYG